MTEKTSSSIPRHVAIIMDGNGRWARQRGLRRIEGHRQGAESVKAVLRVCQKAGVKYLTLYAFSTENWSRPKTEIAGLMKLLAQFLRENEPELRRKRIRLRAIGRLQDLPQFVRTILEHVIKTTADYDQGNLILALSYGGRDEIACAARLIAQKALEGKLAVAEIDEAAVARHLYAPDVPDPDLMIRTSGEMRLSNFLLWQLSYAELYVTPTLWPDFREEQFWQALEEYARRQRRFGNSR